MFLFSASRIQRPVSAATNTRSPKFLSSISTKYFSRRRTFGVMFGFKYCRKLNHKLEQVLQLTKGIDMKVSELAGVLNTLVAQVEKIRAEVQALKDSLANVDLPEAATTALANLDTALKGVDEINPDQT